MKIGGSRSSYVGRKQKCRKEKQYKCQKVEMLNIRVYESINLLHLPPSFLFWTFVLSTMIWNTGSVFKNLKLLEARRTPKLFEQKSQQGLISKDIEIELESGLQKLGSTALCFVFLRIFHRIY